MMHLRTAFGLLLIVSSRGLTQELQSPDTMAIERQAAAHIARTLTEVDIGFDGVAFTAQGKATQRDTTRIAALARDLRARVVEANKVLSCDGNPSTCRMSVGALVRIGMPRSAPEGARIVVEVRRQSGIKRQPISRVSEELILSKQNGAWKVVGVDRRSAS